ncbi:MAG: LuxR C-terminal-related transcriptional regulator [Anaerolineales bacterium]
MPTRILVVDETPVLGEAIAEALRQQRDFEVTAVVHSLDQARSLLDEVDIVILSESLDNADTQKVLDLSSEKQPDLPVILIGRGELPEPSSESADFSDYWDKGQTSASLIKSIRFASPQTLQKRADTGPLRANLARMDEVRTALQEAVRISHALSEKLGQQLETAREHTRDNRIRRTTGITLTDRQQEVLELIAQGLSNPEIAQRLHITEGTTKNHVHNILTRFGVNSREEAVLFYRGKQNRKSGSSD